MIVEDLIQKICPVSDPDCDYTVEDITVSNGYTLLYDFWSNSNVVWNVVCLRLSNFSTTYVSDIFMWFSTNSNYEPYNKIQFSNNFPYQFECIYMNWRYFMWSVTAWYSPITFDLELFVLNDLLSTSIPEKTSLECQTEYNLIPVEDVDINYCVENQLCPNESWTGDFSGDLQFSNIYINDILHPWKQNIFVNIPDYIMWDYNVVGDDFNIYVGSGYDVDYINSVIDINSYRPTSSDFTNVFVGGLTLIFPYIVIVLFIVFIRKLIKRIFK